MVTFAFVSTGCITCRLHPPAVYPEFFLCAKDLEVITRDGQRSVTGTAGAAHRPRRCVLRVAHGQAEGSTGSSRERRSRSSFLPSRSHPDQSRPRPNPDGSVRTVPSAEERLLSVDQRHGALMNEYETLRSLHDELCAAHDPLGTPPFLRRIGAELSPAAHRRQLLVLQSARPSRPIRSPALSQPPTHRIGSSSSAAPRTSSSASATSMIEGAISYPACSASSTKRRAGLCTA